MRDLDPGCDPDDGGGGGGNNVVPEPASLAVWSFLALAGIGYGRCANDERRDTRVELGGAPRCSQSSRPAADSSSGVSV